MILDPRKFAISVLVVVVLSHVAVSVHASKHISEDVVDCEVCSSFSHPPDVLTIDEVRLPPPAAPQNAHLQSNIGSLGNVARLSPARGPPPIN